MSSSSLGAPTQPNSLGTLLRTALFTVHHRGQVAMLVRMLGYTPGNFDIILEMSRTRCRPDLGK